jgi:hypothetical protein
MSIRILYVSLVICAREKSALFRQGRFLKTAALLEIAGTPLLNDAYKVGDRPVSSAFNIRGKVTSRQLAPAAVIA